MNTEKGEGCRTHHEENGDKLGCEEKPVWPCKIVDVKDWGSMEAGRILLNVLDKAKGGCAPVMCGASDGLVHGGELKEVCCCEVEEEGRGEEDTAPRHPDLGRR